MGRKQAKVKRAAFKVAHTLRKNLEQIKAEVRKLSAQSAAVPSIPGLTHVKAAKKELLVSRTGLLSLMNQQRPVVKYTTMQGVDSKGRPCWRQYVPTSFIEAVKAKRAKLDPTRMSTSDAAKELDCWPTTVLDYIKAGRLDGKKEDAVPGTNKAGFYFERPGWSVSREAVAKLKKELRTENAQERPRGPRGTFLKKPPKVRVESTVAKIGRPTDPKVQEVKKECYERFNAGDKLEVIRARCERLFGKKRAPKQAGHVVDNAKWYAEKYKLPITRKTHNS